MQCIKCGGDMIGDDYTMVLHCEYVEDISGYEPDAGPIYCDFKEEPVKICQDCGDISSIE